MFHVDQPPRFLTFVYSLLFLASGVKKPVRMCRRMFRLGSARRRAKRRHDSTDFVSSWWRSIFPTVQIMHSPSFDRIRHMITGSTCKLELLNTYIKAITSKYVHQGHNLKMFLYCLTREGFIVHDISGAGSAICSRLLKKCYLKSRHGSVKV